MKAQTGLRPTEPVVRVTRVVCKGDHIQTWVNGVKVTDLKDDMTKSGFVGLQVHGVGDRTEPLRASWRNIRIREL